MPNVAELATVCATGAEEINNKKGKIYCFMRKSFGRNGNVY
jgi:hypothetical protein